MSKLNHTITLSNNHLKVFESCTQNCRKIAPAHPSLPSCWTEMVSTITRLCQQPFKILKELLAALSVGHSLPALSQLGRGKGTGFNHTLTFCVPLHQCPKIYLHAIILTWHPRNLACALSTWRIVRGPAIDSDA